MPWINDVEAYCNKYNVPVEYLADVLHEPKVVPMIRGKAFEFSAMLKLQTILPPETWRVDKPVMNAQLGSHDMDVRVIHIPTGREISVECKLAKNNSFRTRSTTGYDMRVKCMRSRTLGTEMVRTLAPRLGVTEEILSIHNDQYVPTDFDMVMTSIGNAFYRTNQDTGSFDWSPNPQELEFLRHLFEEQDDNRLKDLTYNKMYIATSHSLAVLEGNDQKCKRRKCPINNSCGFIPNYPFLEFVRGQRIPRMPWIDVDTSLGLFEAFVQTD
ncbi:MAG: restriction endonuclease [Bacteroidota bacterium]